MKYGRSRVTVPGINKVMSVALTMRLELMSFSGEDLSGASQPRFGDNVQFLCMTCISERTNDNLYETRADAQGVGDLVSMT